MSLPWHAYASEMQKRMLEAAQRGGSGAVLQCGVCTNYSNASTSSVWRLSMLERCGAPAARVWASSGGQALPLIAARD